jgi:hypothetical protein
LFLVWLYLLFLPKLGGKIYKKKKCQVNFIDMGTLDRILRQRIDATMLMML